MCVCLYVCVCVCVCVSGMWVYFIIILTFQKCCFMACVLSCVHVYTVLCVVGKLCMNTCIYMHIWWICVPIGSITSSHCNLVFFVCMCVECVFVCMLVGTLGCVGRVG